MSERQHVRKITVHPFLASWAEENFDADLVVVDPELAPPRAIIVPMGYAPYIAMTIGFANPVDPKTKKG